MPTATNEWYIFPGIAWYYGDNELIIRASLHVQTQHVWLNIAVPDTDSQVTCSTDMDSCVTCSKKYGFL